MLGGFEAVGRGELVVGDGEPDAVGARLGRGLDGADVGAVLVADAVLVVDTVPVVLFCGCAPGLPDEPAHPAVTDMSRAAAARRVAAAVGIPQRAFMIRP